jgi:ubiquinone/menaquinone biosynthesis C-methylase UbiE
MKKLKMLVRRLQESLERGPIGTRLQEWLWRTRHLYRRGWAQSYLETIDHPHRGQIVEAVAAFHPESVLEIGCASGANLVRLRQSLPHARLHGLDINAEAIRVGREYFAHDRGIALSVGHADQLVAFPDKCQDVVFSDAILILVAPDRIHRVLAEMIRVARKGMVLNEYHAAGETRGHFDGGRWVYDLTAILRLLAPENAHIETRKSAFTGGLWDRYGTLITVRW